MIEQIEQYKTQVSQTTIETAAQLEAFRLHWLSKKGLVNQLFTGFKEVAPADKKLVGQYINDLKNLLSEKYDTAKQLIENTQTVDRSIDLSLPTSQIYPGSRHPLSIVRNEINRIFKNLGFIISEGPEIEDDWHVFSALNFPEHHPARDMQDTFFIENNLNVLLRTHTSSVQVRVMENTQPPIRTISPGRVFRNEAISARAHCIFHQVEGLYIDKNVSFADLKQTLLYFSKEMFGEDTSIRLRPSFFPFTEPSAEMDISCRICHGKGCPICKYSGWVEILGCGMVDPNVLSLCNIDNKKYTGFAFGMGIERIAILKYRINDIRLFFENDIRFLKQFVSG
jgi:phenylalanyl-tRNA synthetase alpha chain